MGIKYNDNQEVIYVGFIYLATNKINGKVYVGKTKYTISKRWSQHKCEAKRLIPNVYFVRALNKYGPDNFEVIQLEECNNNLLNERERYYISLYNSNNKDIGYNRTNGGDGAEKYCPDDIYKLWLDGLTLTEINQELNCCTQTASMILKGFGITESEIRSRAQTRQSEVKKKPVLQYDLNGNFIKRYSCVEEAVQATGFHENNIRGVCNHRLHTANGYIWCHEDEPKTIEQLLTELPLEKTKRPISQYTLDGILVKQYNSINEAAQTLKVHRSSIEDALSNKSFNCQGYLWKYQDDDEDILEKVKRNNSKKDYAKIAVNQYDLQNNLIATYASAAEAAIAIGKPGNGSSITKVCRGKLKTAYKFKWAYA